MKIAENLIEYLTNDDWTLPRFKTIDEILDQVIALHRRNPAGFTYNAYFGDLASQGFYVVSLYPDRSRPVADEADFDKLLRYFVERNLSLLADPRNNVGGWHNDAIGSTTLDVSSALLDYEEAIRLGRYYNQQSLYSLADDTETYLGGTGRPLPGWPPEAERLPQLGER